MDHAHSKIRNEFIVMRKCLSQVYSEQQSCLSDNQAYQAVVLVEYDAAVSSFVQSREIK